MFVIGKQLNTVVNNLKRYNCLKKLMKYLKVIENIRYHIRNVFKVKMNNSIPRGLSFYKMSKIPIDKL